KRHKRRGAVPQRCAARQAARHPRRRTTSLRKLDSLRRAASRISSYENKDGGWPAIFHSLTPRQARFSPHLTPDKYLGFSEPWRVHGRGATSPFLSGYPKSEPDPRRTFPRSREAEGSRGASRAP